MNNFPKYSGEYYHYDFCRFCNSKTLYEFLDMGHLPLAGGFLTDATRKTILTEKYYPLKLAFCTKCFLVQTTDVVAADTLFKNYFYHSSTIKTLVSLFEKTAASLQTYLPDKNSFVVEIGCNDGTFLESVQQHGYRVLGVDPATNIVKPLIKKGKPIIDAYFSEETAKKIIKTYGHADAIYSFNTLAHIENMHNVFRGIDILLKPAGYLAFDVHYLGSVIRRLQYDMIYHEHQYYYSLLAMKQFVGMHGMEVFDIELLPTHGGSIRFYVQKKGIGKRSISSKVKKLVEKERKLRFDKPIAYKNFAKRIQKTKENLSDLLHDLNRKGRTIAGYGASGRGTIIMNYCEIMSPVMSYVVDDSPAKQGIFTPGVHLPSFSSKKLYGKNPPEYVLLFAWSFASEIIKKHIKYLKNGGIFIVPLPKIKLIKK